MGEFQCMNPDEFENYKNDQFAEMLREHGKKRPLVTERPSSSEGPIYDFDYPYRGLAVIFNIWKFEDSDTRVGSASDNSKLCLAFRDLGFDQIYFNNLTKEQFLDAAKDASERYNHQDADCFVCAVLSHGGQEYCETSDGTRETSYVIQCSDGKTIPMKEITELFNDVNCEGLQKKPRLFFIQACRGDKEDPGAGMPLPQENGTEIKKTKEKKDSHVEEFRDAGPAKPEVGNQNEASVSTVTELNVTLKRRIIEVYSVPLPRHFLIMYATPPGYVAWRNDGGTAFVDNLFHMLYCHESIKTMSFLSALTYVAGRIATAPDGYEYRKMPVIESRLCKDLVMAKKEYNES